MVDYGDFGEKDQFACNGLLQAHEKLMKAYNKLKKNLVAPYCNSCLSQDVHATSKTVTCYDCGAVFPFKEIKQ